MPCVSNEVNCAVCGNSRRSTCAERWSAQLLEDGLAYKHPVKFKALRVWRVQVRPKWGCETGLLTNTQISQLTIAENQEGSFSLRVCLCVWQKEVCLFVCVISRYAKPTAFPEVGDPIFNHRVFPE